MGLDPQVACGRPCRRIGAGRTAAQLTVVGCTQVGAHQSVTHERQVSALAGDGIAATLETTRAKVGGAAPAIARVARAHESDAIVVGTRGHSPIAGLLVGSVTQRLLHISPCPVIAVPTREADGNG
jgi:nucleotide-binding universal stress UspA family protein